MRTQFSTVSTGAGYGALPASARESAMASIPRKLFWMDADPEFIKFIGGAVRWKSRDGAGRHQTFKRVQGASAFNVTDDIPSVIFPDDGAWAPESDLLHMPIGSEFSIWYVAKVQMTAGILFGRPYATTPGGAGDTQLIHQISDAFSASTTIRSFRSGSFTNQYDIANPSGFGADRRFGIVGWNSVDGVRHSRSDNAAELQDCPNAGSAWGPLTVGEFAIGGDISSAGAINTNSFFGHVHAVAAAGVDLLKTENAALLAALFEAERDHWQIVGA